MKRVSVLFLKMLLRALLIVFTPIVGILSFAIFLCVLFLLPFLYIGTGGITEWYKKFIVLFMVSEQESLFWSFLDLYDKVEEL